MHFLDLLLPLALTLELLTYPPQMQRMEDQISYIMETTKQLQRGRHWSRTFAHACLGGMV